MPSLLDARSHDVEIHSTVHDVRGVPLHARHVSGPGRPPVVLVHGMVVSSRYFEPTMRELAGTADVWAPELPGHGLTPHRDGGPGGVEAFADDLLGWMDAVELPGAVVVANSFGCQVAVDAAVRHPDRIRALVLQGVTVDPHARSRRAQVSRWLRTGLHEDLGQAPLLVRDYLDFGPSRVPAMVDAVLDDAIEHKLPSVEQPTVVVAGTLDAIAPQDWAEEVVRLLPRGRLVLVPGAAHALNFTHPHRLAAVVADVPGGW